MRSKYKWIFTLLVALSVQFSFAQEKTVTGVVSDASGTLPGANVVVQGTKTSTQTDANGKYTIKAKVGDVLVFSFVNYTSATAKIGAANVYNAKLSEGKVLTDVVVAQGRTRSKKALTYDVSNLKSTSLENKPQTDVVRSMQGKITGVQITNTGGMAGSSSNIVIRGNKSFTGSAQPLFIIDGVPFDASSSAVTSSFNQGASSASSRFGDIDPNNIESMSILKGLAASVVYGSQGRNGVVLITTKGGKKNQKMRASYSSSMFLSEIANLPDYQNTYGGGSLNNVSQGTIGNWGAVFDGSAQPHIYDQPSITAVYPQFAGATNAWVAAPNNVKDFFRKGFSSVHGLNLSGGTDNVVYAFNATHSNEDGMVAHNNVTKYNFGGNFTVQATDRLKFETALNYYNTNYTSPPIGAANGVGVSSIFERLLYIPRNYDIMNLPYQNPLTGASIYYRTDLENPRWLLENARNSQVVNRFFGKFGATYNLRKGLDVTYRFGIDRYVDEQEFYQHKGGNELATLNGYLRNTTGVNTLMNQDIIFDIKPIKLATDVKLSGLVGFNSRRDVFEQTGIASINQSQFGQADHTYFANQANLDPVLEIDLDRPKEWTNILGVYASAEFSYKDYLYATLAGRKDYVSTVEKENQSIIYPSASLSFIASDAFPSLRGKYLDYWKLRAAYGTSAGFPDRYLTRNQAVFNSAILAGTTVTPGTSISNLLGNPNLKPELHKEFEIGTDLELFNKRVEIGFSAYYKISENQIVERSLDPASGYTRTNINAGQIDNRGIEGTFAVTPFKTNNFSWESRVLFYKNVSEVVSLPEGQERISIAGFSNGIGNYAIVGQPYGVFVGTYALKDNQGRFLINPTNGTVISNDQVGLPNDIIGNPNPEYTMSFDNTFTYKGFTLNALFEYTKGGDFYSNTISNLLRRGVTTDTEENRLGTAVIPGVFGNPSTGAVILDSNGNSIANNIQLPMNQVYFLNLVDPDSNVVYDATRVRLREVSLGYNFPSAWLKNTGLTSLNFSLTGQNMWLKTFNIPKGTNVDPDLISTGAGNGLGLDFQTAPQSRRYGFSVKVNF